MGTHVFPASLAHGSTCLLTTAWQNSKITERCCATLALICGPRLFRAGATLSQAELGLLNVCQRGSCDCSALDMPGKRSFDGSDHPIGRLEKSGVQVAGQAVPITKEVTSGVVRPGGKEVARIADKYSDDATRDKVQVRYCQ